jgi:hypothetical protein
MPTTRSATRASPTPSNASPPSLWRRFATTPTTRAGRASRPVSIFRPLVRACSCSGAARFSAPWAPSPYTSRASTACRATRTLGAQRTRSEPNVEPWLSSWAPSAWSTSVPRSRLRPGRSLLSPGPSSPRGYRRPRSTPGPTTASRSDQQHVGRLYSPTKNGVARVGAGRLRRHDGRSPVAIPEGGRPHGTGPMDRVGRFLAPLPALGTGVPSGLGGAQPVPSVTSGGCCLA